MGRINSQNLQYLLKKHTNYVNIKIFVETGTMDGTQNKLATDSQLFEKIYGIELNEHWANVTQTLNPNSEIIHGDTTIELPKLLNKYHSEPLFIYLDAHFCGTNPPIEKSKFPLWDELQLIKDRNIQDIIVVDDVHAFGQVRNDLKFTPDSKEWETVTTESINNFLSPRIFNSEILGDSYVIYLK